MVLDRIKKVNDIKQLNEEELEELQEEIRDFLVENIAKTGGHLASNLGVIELTMALHLSFDLTRDRIIWDVGHQSYTHKILTGRKLGFATLRQYGGMSGFPKTQEDPADAAAQGFVSLETVLREADIITLHVPLTKEGPHKTFHLLDSLSLDI
jgi:1-deoxy-D-xylulose-5-phosphate synthase